MGKHHILSTCTKLHVQGQTTNIKSSEMNVGMNAEVELVIFI